MEKEILVKLSQLVADGDEDGALKAVDEALAAGIPPLEVLNEGGTKGMNIVNERYDEGEAYLPELVVAGDTMTKVVEKIFENIPAGEVKRAGTIVIGQATGDVHDIGKNVVCAMLRVNGFEVHDLGADVPVKKFWETAKEVKADVIAMSTLMTASMPFMRDLPKMLSEVSQREDYFYIIGGGPVTTEFASEIGADGWARSAFDAVKLCKTLIEKHSPAAGTHLVDLAAGIDC